MDAKSIIELILKVVAMAMAVVSIVMGFFPKSVSEKSRCLLREENAGGSEGTQVSNRLSPAPAVSADKAKLAT